MSYMSSKCWNELFVFSVVVAYILRFPIVVISTLQLFVWAYRCHTFVNKGFQCIHLIIVLPVQHDAYRTFAISFINILFFFCVETIFWPVNGCTYLNLHTRRRPSIITIAAAGLLYKFFTARSAILRPVYCARAWSLLEEKRRSW